MTHVISGQDLINAGLAQGKWFGPALKAANEVLETGGSFSSALARAIEFSPPPTLSLRRAGEIDFFVNIEAETPEEIANVEAVKRTMTEIMRTPVVKAGAIMPDACPAGPIGTIPVGGVIASEAMHPGLHSADACCSVMITIFDGVSPAALLDAAQAVTHFGPGERDRGKQVRPDDAILEAFAQNQFLSDLVSPAIGHFATQGDGNHFVLTGTVRDGRTAMVTHHGSRAPGARLFTKGMKVAETFRRQLSPETLACNAWIPADTKEGDSYWEALQIIRLWTKANHQVIHQMTADLAGGKAVDSWWNEHNYVFRKGDGLFYHAKGATPAFDGWAEDATELTLVPMTMADGVLITRGKNAAHGLGFAPHGAGRNLSRTAHKRLQEGRTNEEIFAAETAGIDARFYSGVIDISELPSAYKDAANVQRQIEKFDLAEVVDEVTPYGCIMAGDWEANAPWRKKRERRS